MQRRIIVLLVMSGFLAGCTEGGSERAPDETSQGVEPGGPTGGSRQTSTETTSTGPSAPKTWTVVMEDVAFTNGTLAVRPGDTVRWVHEDGSMLHRVETRDDTPDSFDSGDMTAATNSVFSFTFDTEGEYGYFCRYHEGVMSEMITVSRNETGQVQGPSPEPPGNSTGNSTSSGPPRGPVEWDIEIRGVAFVAGTITVQAGDTVIWTHRDGAIPHTVTADGGAFDSGPVYMVEAPVVDTFESTFDEVGTFPYFCEVHPSMQNVITVFQRHDGVPS